MQHSPKSKSPSADDHELLTHVALCQLPALELCSAAWCVGCIPSHPWEHFTAWFCERWRAASRGPAMPAACLFISLSPPRITWRRVVGEEIWVLLVFIWKTRQKPVRFIKSSLGPSPHLDSCYWDGSLACAPDFILFPHTVCWCQCDVLKPHPHHIHPCSGWALLPGKDLVTTCEWVSFRTMALQHVSHLRTWYKGLELALDDRGCTSKL